MFVGLCHNKGLIHGCWCQTHSLMFEQQVKQKVYWLAHLLRLLDFSEAPVLDYLFVCLVGFLSRVLCNLGSYPACLGWFWVPGLLDSVLNVLICQVNITILISFAQVLHISTKTHTKQLLGNNSICIAVSG